MPKNYLYYKAINWNHIEDELDNAVWERATSLFWLDTRIPIEEDKPKWEGLSKKEQDQLNRSLLLLAQEATYQSIEAGQIIRNSQRSQQEIAILNNLQFTEMVATKAYNRILRVFNDDSNLQVWLDWVDGQEFLQKRLKTIDAIYNSKDPLAKRFAAICLEGLMNYSLLAYPLYLWQSKGFTSLGLMLEMVIRNESLHCYYLGHKVKLLLTEVDQDEVKDFENWARDFVDKLVQQEEDLIEDYFLLDDAKALAKDLLHQEANHILENFGLGQSVYPFGQGNLAGINRSLQVLRQHDLTSSSAKSVLETEDVMTDDDYDF